LKIIIFDEFSMISKSVYELIKNDFENRSIFFIGDSAQLLPVMSQLITKEFDLIKFTSSDSFHLPRFKNNASYNFEKFIIDFRNRILFKTMPDDMINFNSILDIFKRNLDREPLEKKIIDFNTHFKMCYNEIKMTKKPLEKKINPIIVGKNVTHEIIYKKLLFECKEHEILPACIFLEFADRNKKLIDNMNKYIKHEPHDKFFLDELKCVPGNIGSIFNKICVGCSIVFRKNIKNKVFNGQRAIVTNIIYPKDFEVVEIKKILVDNQELKICIYKGTLPKLEFESNGTFDKSISIANFEFRNSPFIVLYAQLAYCSTLYQTQGSTLESSYCVTDCILLGQILRCFYVLVSRATDPEQIIMSQNVFNKTIRKFFCNK